MNWHHQDNHPPSRQTTRSSGWSQDRPSEWSWDWVGDHETEWLNTRPTTRASGWLPSWPPGCQHTCQFPLHMYIVNMSSNTLLNCVFSIWRQASIWFNFIKIKTQLRFWKKIQTYLKFLLRTKKYLVNRWSYKIFKFMNSNFFKTYFFKLVGG